jgi:hypothetical protein
LEFGAKLSVANHQAEHLKSILKLVPQRNNLTMAETHIAEQENSKVTVSLSVAIE